MRVKLFETVVVLVAWHVAVPSEIEVDGDCDDVADAVREGVLVLIDDEALFVQVKVCEAETDAVREGEVVCDKEDDMERVGDGDVVDDAENVRDVDSDDVSVVDRVAVHLDDVLELDTDNVAVVVSDVVSECLVRVSDADALGLVVFDVLREALGDVEEDALCVKLGEGDSDNVRV